MAANNILPESLHPALARPGFGGQGRYLVQHTRPDGYPVTERGLWLPPLNWSAKELGVAAVQMAELATNKHDIYEDLARITGKLMLVDEVGCWSPVEKLTSEEHVQLLRLLAEEERVQIILDTDEEFPAMKICDTQNCMCPRHYDFTYGTDSQRREKHTIDEELYVELPDGTIQTAWLDILPSLRESAGRLYDLQHKCFPYTSLKDGVMPPASIAKVTFNNVTGCWEVRSYYNKPRGSKNKTMYDGYGRLTRRAHIDSNENKKKSVQIMGHRVVWWIMNGGLVKGYDINHFCVNRPCCFDGHSEEDTHGSNVRHGRSTQIAKKALKEGTLARTPEGFKEIVLDFAAQEPGSSTLTS